MRSCASCAATVEELQNSNESLRKQQRDLYADLDRRLRRWKPALKGGPAPAAGGAIAGGVSAPVGGSGGSGAPGPEDQAAYNRAFEALKNSDYTGAIAQFKDFLRHYPKSALADNAQYWLGEGYYVTRDYDDAASAFRAVGGSVSAVPQGAGRAAEARLHAIRSEHLADARATLGAGGADAIPAAMPPSWRPQRLSKIPPDAP